jgi:chemotaxis protein CheD
VTSAERAQGDEIVGVGVLRLVRAPGRLRALGVGSCVAVSLWDRALRQGGLAHVPLPERTDPDEPLEEFVDTALPLLVELLARSGSPGSRLEAKAAGGASVLLGAVPSRALSIAARNVAALEQVLARLGIPLVGRELGGSAARSVELDAGSGELRVLSLPDRVRVL